jgi:hypothetical protein
VSCNLSKIPQESSPETCTCDLDLTCRYARFTSTPVRSGLRSGVPGNRRSRPGLRSGGSRDLDLRPGPDRSISRPVFSSHAGFSMEEGQERDCSPNEERYIIDDDDMQDSPTDSPELWMSERNEDDTKFVRVLEDP